MNTVEMLFGKFLNFVEQTYWVNIDLLAISFLISCSIALVVMLIELYYVGLKGSSLQRVIFDRSGSTSTDIFYFIIHASGLITLFAVLFSFGIPQAISTLVKSFVSFDLGFEMNIYYHLIVFLLLADFMNYWQHRLMHMIPMLWQIHRFHHSAEEFNVLTVFREHPLDKAFNSIFMIIPGVLLGNPVGEFAVFITIYGMVGYVQHSRIPWQGKIGTYIIQSPRDHWIHHSKLEKHHDTNFGSTFAFWDHIFGTYSDGGEETPVLGLYDTKYNQINAVRATFVVQYSFLVVFLDTFKLNLKRLMEGFRHW
ncbi:sterol desaturase family protein [Pseudomonadales bacterium]|nr:sterol desaturase family protein [Pseudomonadales bacterium]